MVGGETARVREDHVGDAGAALQAEDRGARVGRMGTDHGDRQRDQPRVRVGAVLGHHERSAVGGVGALFGGVGTVLERQLACTRAGRHGDGRRTAGEVEVAEPEREDGDQGQAGDPASPKAFCGGLLAVTGERLVVLVHGVSFVESGLKHSRRVPPSRTRFGGTARRLGVRAAHTGGTVSRTVRGRGCRDMLYGSAVPR